MIALLESSHNSSSSPPEGFVLAESIWYKNINPEGDCLLPVRVDLDVRSEEIPGRRIPLGGVIEVVEERPLTIDWTSRSVQYVRVRLASGGWTTKQADASLYLQQYVYAFVYICLYLFMSGRICINRFELSAH